MTYFKTEVAAINDTTLSQEIDVLEELSTFVGESEPEYVPSPDYRPAAEVKTPLAGSSGVSALTTLFTPSGFGSPFINSLLPQWSFVQPSGSQPLLSTRSGSLTSSSTRPGSQPSSSTQSGSLTSPSYSSLSSQPSPSTLSIGSLASPFFTSSPLFTSLGSQPSPSTLSIGSLTSPLFTSFSSQLLSSPLSIGSLGVPIL